MSRVRKNMEQQRKVLKKSRRWTIVDFVIIIIILAGLTTYYGYLNERNKEFVSGSKNTPKPIVLASGSVTFFDAQKNKSVQIFVDIAENEYQQSKGLMFQESFPDNQGMLFTYETEMQRFFWMKNTPVPLDIIYINGALKVVKIHKNTQPYSESIYASEEVAQFVVEVNAGFCDRYGIELGHSISWKKDN